KAEQRRAEKQPRPAERLGRRVNSHRCFHSVHAKSPGIKPRWCYRTLMRSDRVMMNVLSVLKSRTSTAGLCGVIIVDSRSTGVETSTNGNAGCMMVSTGCDLTAGFRT